MDNVDNYRKNQKRDELGRWAKESNFFKKWGNAPYFILKNSEWNDITDIKELRKKVKRYLLDTTRNIPLAHPELGNVRFSRKSIDEFITYSTDKDKLLAAKQIPEFVRNGKLGEYETSNKDRKIIRGDMIEGFYPIYSNLITPTQVKKAEILIAKDEFGYLFFDLFLDYDREEAIKKRGNLSHNQASLNNSITDNSKNFNPDVKNNCKNDDITLEQFIDLFKQAAKEVLSKKGIKF